MDPIALLTYLGGAFLTVGLFYAVAKRKSRPVYGDDPYLQGVKLFRLACWIALPVGILLSFLQSLAVTGLDLVGFSTVVLTTMVTYLLVIFAYTDHRHRMADRVLLHWAIGLGLALAIPRLIELQSEPTAVIFVFSVLMSFAVMFVPSMGASDARSFMLLFIVGLPTLGIMPTYYTFVVGIVLWLLYGIVFAIRQRSFKVSIPLVPYILLPLAAAPIIISLSLGVPRFLSVLS